MDELRWRSAATEPLRQKIKAAARRGRTHRDIKLLRLAEQAAAVQDEIDVYQSDHRLDDDSVWERFERMLDKLDRIAKRIIASEARTKAGLAAQILATMLTVGPRLWEDDEPHESRQFIRTASRFAGVRLNV
jgi:phage shock protein A